MNLLQGKTILITRAWERFSESSALLNALGAECISFPTIEILPPVSWSECDRAIHSIIQFDAIIFTSANAAEYFFSRSTEKTIEALNAMSVYVVGQKTFQTVVQFGIIPVAPPDIFDAKHLAKMILVSGVKRKRFLFPKGDKAKNFIPDELRSEGVDVTELVVYRTMIPSFGEIEYKATALLNKSIDIITFFSPSSIEHCLKMLPNEYISTAVVAVNGPLTAIAAKQFGLIPHIIAEQPTNEGMAKAIEQFYTNHS